MFSPDFQMEYGKSVMHMCIYIYIYTEREREREDRKANVMKCTLGVFCTILATSL